MSAPADFQQVDEAGGRAVRLTGSLTLACMRDLPERLAAVPGPVAAVDLSGVERIDTIGAWIVRRFARERDARIDNASDDAARLIMLGDADVMVAGGAEAPIS